MPEISRFFGITIQMFYEDHPPPHFHVRYGDQRATVSLNSLEILHGSISPRVHSLLREWATLHQDELREDWGLAREKQPLKRIEPLE